MAVFRGNFRAQERNISYIEGGVSFGAVKGFLQFLGIFQVMLEEFE